MLLDLTLIAAGITLGSIYVCYVHYGTQVLVYTLLALFVICLAFATVGG